MKKFVVHYNYYATIDVEVLAENEEEAKAKADQISIDPRDYDFCLNERSVIDVEDGVDLATMFKEIIARVKRYMADHSNKPMPFAHHVTCDVDSIWNGAAYVSVRDAATGLAWNENEQSLVVSFEQNEAMKMDELSDIDQYYIAKSVLP